MKNRVGNVENPVAIAGFLVTIKRQVIFPEIEGPYETDIRREDGKKRFYKGFIYVAGVFSIVACGFLYSCTSKRVKPIP